jgi:2-polyprenyl-6-methoxyphenol hydroxylase-like FAD-dependent oxidoreductase
MTHGGREEEFDVVVQGAGIGGLTLAIALVRHGYSVRVVERAQGLSEVGAGIWMAANPMQVFERLGFAEKIAAAGWPVRVLRLQDYRGGDIHVTDLTEAAREFGFETVALHRAVLQRVLFEQLPTGTVVFGTEIRTLEQGPERVWMQLTNGARMTAKAAVGADGIHSKMRGFLSLGGEKRYSGSSSYRAIARGARLPELGEHEAYEIWGVGCRVGFSKINAGINAEDYYWYMTFESAEGESELPEEMRRHAERIFMTYFPKWIGLLEATPAEAILRTDITDLKPLKRWSAGRVGLVGDAAHATTPNLGQGGAMAVEDALALVKAFEAAGLNEAAWQRFEQGRRKKVEWIVATSWTIGRLCHVKNPMGRWLRNAFLMYLPKSSDRKQMARMYSIE